MSDISHLDFELSDELKALTSEFDAKPKYVAIVSPIEYPDLFAAFAICCGVNGKIIAGKYAGEKVTVLFMNNPEERAGEKAAKNLLEHIDGLTLLLVAYKLGKLVVKEYFDSNLEAKDFVPTMFISGVSSELEEIFLGSKTIDDFEYFDLSKMTISKAEKILQKYRIS
ncbi:MAG: hypothetical protein LBM13_00060 [Candidatus Ancillula sp.]|jgi:hypothetical protein|nr:hypothetical protein [Candidatus Ancillula sp.]